MNYYIYGRTTTAVSRRRIRAESIHKIVSVITRCNFAIYLAGLLIGINYATWLDVSMIANVAVMSLLNGVEE